MQPETLIPMVPCSRRTGSPSSRIPPALLLSLLVLAGMIPTRAGFGQDTPPPQRSSPFNRGPRPTESPAAATPTPIPQSSIPDRPTVVLPESSRPSPGDEAQDLSLEILTEADGNYVTFTELLRVIRLVDPRAQGRWDGSMGVFRLEASGHRLQALSNQPVLVVDGKTMRVAKPIRVSGGVALIPAGSVNEIFKSLGYDFALPDDVNAADARPPSTARPQPPPRPSALAADDSLLSDVGNRNAMTQLDIPQVDASIAGMTWADLMDYAHPRAPQRMTLVYDAALEDMARTIGALSQRAGQLEVAYVRAGQRRDDPALLTRVAQSRPEILIDLLTSAERDDVEFRVWSVHEALWAPVVRTKEEKARPLRDLYVVHQFHNLALGSLLRAELARGYPEGSVRHELSPYYLLRRVDAPSAAIVVPSDLVSGDDRDSDRIARAVAGAFAGYYRGVASATRR